MKCNNCGKEIVEDSAFCSYCGSKVVRERYCINCGVKIALDAAFCHKCGTAQQSAPEPAPALPDNPLEDKLDPRVFKREYMDHRFMPVFSAISKAGGIRINGDWVMYVRDNVIHWTSSDGKRRGTVPYETEQEIQLVGFNNEGIWIIDGNEKYINRKLVVLDINGGVLYEKTNPDEHMLDAGQIEVVGREYMYYDGNHYYFRIGSMDRGDETENYPNSNLICFCECIAFTPRHIFFKDEIQDYNWHWIDRADKSGKKRGRMISKNEYPFLMYLLVEQKKYWVENHIYDDDDRLITIKYDEYTFIQTPSKHPALRSMENVDDLLIDNLGCCCIYFDGDRRVTLTLDDDAWINSMKRIEPNGEEVVIKTVDEEILFKKTNLVNDKLIVACLDKCGFAIYPRNFSAFTGKACDNPEAVPLYGEWK